MVAEISYKGKTYKMVFGMVATEIIGATWYKAIENGTNSQIQSIAIVIYGGLCNYAEMYLHKKPDYHEIYQLTCDIAETIPQELEKVYAIWEETKPAKKMIDNLQKVINQFGIKKKVETKSSKRKIGTK